MGDPSPRAHRLGEEVPQGRPEPDEEERRRHPPPDARRGTNAGRNGRSSHRHFGRRLARWPPCTGQSRRSAALVQRAELLVVRRGKFSGPVVELELPQCLDLPRLLGREGGERVAGLDRLPDPGEGGRVHRWRRRAPPPAPPPEHPRGPAEPRHGSQRRDDPHDEPHPARRRRQEDPLAVLGDEVGPDLLGALPRPELVHDQRPHLPRHLRGRVGDGQVLADGAAQARGDLPHSLFEILPGDRRGREDERCHERREGPAPPSLTGSTGTHPCPPAGSGRPAAPPPAWRGSSPRRARRCACR